MNVPRSGFEVKMKSRAPSPQAAPSVVIRVSGKLFEGHLSYLQQLVQHAAECRLWPTIDLANLEELDRPALLFLVAGEKSEFDIVSCPNFLREWIENERASSAAA